MIQKNITFVKVLSKSEIKKFIFESFIYENVFKLKVNKTTYSGTLLQIDNNKKLLLIRFPDDITQYFKPDKQYELSFNNSRGKFKTEAILKNIALKGGRTYTYITFPDYLLRLQRRRSIRVIPEYLTSPVTINLNIKGKQSIFKIRDIGLNGFSLTLNKDNLLSNLRIGEVVNSEIKLPNSKWDIKCKVKIVHGNVVLSKYRAGFEFIEIDSKFKNLLTNYLLIRRTEIKLKILNKDNKKSIAKQSIGEWLESLIEYKKERFQDFKIAILTNKNFEVYNIITEHFPSTTIFKLEEFSKLETNNYNLIILHLTPENKSIWYKISKISNIKYTPLIIIYRDGSILHFLKDKPFYSKIVEEKKCKEEIINEILLFSNITVQPVDFTILSEKPYYDGNNKKILIVDSSAFNFSMKTLLDSINFQTKFIENINKVNSFEKFDIVIYSANLSFKEDMKNIFNILEKGKYMVITFDRQLPYSNKLIELFEDKNILIKPFKYDTLINKVLFISDEEDINTYFKEIVIPLITNNTTQLPKAIENYLRGSIYDSLFTFDVIDSRNVDIHKIKNKNVLIDIHTGVVERYPITKFIGEFSKRYKINFYGIIYKSISKKFILNCIKSGLKSVFILNQVVDKLKEFIIFS